MNKLFLGSCLGFMLYGNLYPTTVDEIKLTRIANELGYKTANLQVLKTLSEQKDIMPTIKPYNLVVPIFEGLESSSVKRFLKSHGLDLDKTWNSLCQQHIFDGTDKVKIEIVRDKKLPKEFIEALTNTKSGLCTRIQKIFSDYTFDFPKEFISKFSKQKVMVRSTGKEDSKKHANAGGNISVANVPPTPIDISLAMGEVVASYLSKRSLGQRLLAAHSEEEIQSVFNKPFVPVLIQVMIGEPAGGLTVEAYEDVKKVPVSGVMFTTEAEGNTPGITHIQTSFGHNEGVVASLVAVDSFYVSENNTIHTIIREKKNRLVPEEKTDTGKYGLCFFKNHYAMRAIPTLKKSSILALKKLAQHIEHFYNDPMDVEFVINHETKTIHLVQARPIVRLETTAQPSYLSSDFIDSFHDDLVTGTKIGIGNGKVSIINDPKQIIIEKTLEAALMRYIDKTEDERRVILCIIIQEPAATNSHEATTFRGEQKKILHLTNTKLIQAWLEKPDTQLIVDIQRGIIVHTTNQRNVIGSHEIEGWFTHPISSTQSLQKNVTTLVSMGKKLFPLEDVFPDKSMRELVEMVKNGSKTNQTRSLRALKSILFRLISFLKTITKESLTESIEHERDIYSILTKTYTDLNQLAEQMRTIITDALMCAHEIVDALCTINKPRDIQLLYPITFLEALLFQNVTTDIINGYSYAQTINLTKKTRTILSSVSMPKELSPKNRELFIQLIAGGDYVLTEDIGNLWQQFITAIAQDPQHEKLLQDIALLTRDLNKNLSLFSLWLHTEFASHAKSGIKNAPKLLMRLKENYSKISEHLNSLQNIDERIENFKNAQWQQPEKFESLKTSFKSAVLDSFTSPDLQNAFTDASNLAKQAQITVMQHLVDTFDTIIKKLKSSSLYSEESIHVGNFKTLLFEYLSLLKNWCSIPLIKDTLNKMDISDYYLNNLLEKPLHDIPATTRQQFLPSQAFNVSFSMFGTNNKGLRWREESWAADENNSLEDAFTLIHQNLLFILSILTQTTGIQEIQKPSIIDYFLKIIPDMNNFIEHLKTHSAGVMCEGDMRGILTQISEQFTAHGIAYRFNLPLRSHSSSFTLSYQTKTQTLVFEAEFLDPWASFSIRWDFMRDCLNLITSVLPIKSSHELELTRVGRKQEDAIIHYAMEIQEKDFEHDKKLIDTLLKIFILIGRWSMAIHQQLEAPHKMAIAQELYTYLFEKFEKALDIIQQNLTFENFAPKEQHIDPIFYFMVRANILIQRNDEPGLREILSTVLKMARAEEKSARNDGLKILILLLNHKLREAREAAFSIVKENYEQQKENLDLEIFEVLETLMKQQDVAIFEWLHSNVATNYTSQAFKLLLEAAIKHPIVQYENFIETTVDALIKQAETQKEDYYFIKNCMTLFELHENPAIQKLDRKITDLALNLVLSSHQSYADGYISFHWLVDKNYLPKINQKEFYKYGEEDRAKKWVAEARKKFEAEKDDVKEKEESPQIALQAELNEKLGAAVRQGYNLNEILSLIKEGADVNAQFNGKKIIYWAVYKCKEQTFRPIEDTRIRILGALVKNGATVTEDLLKDKETSSFIKTILKGGDPEYFIRITIGQRR